MCVVFKPLFMLFLTTAQMDEAHLSSLLCEATGVLLGWFNMLLLNVQRFFLHVCHNVPILD